MLVHLSAWWLHLGGVGFFSMVHLFAALGLILALTVADLLWKVQPPRDLSAPAVEPPTPKGRTRAHWPVSSRLHAAVGLHR
jgi:hypothetical protein